MTHEEYLKLPGISASFLKACYQSAYDGYKFLHQPKESTKAMQFGTAVHTMLLEPHLFSDQFAVREKLDRRTKAGKEASEAFEDANKGKIVIDEDDAYKLQKIVANVKAFPQMREALDSFLKEQTYQFEVQGLACKARLDLVDESGHFIIDVKTTKDASSSEFAKTMINMNYDLQLAHYALATGKKQNKAFVIAVETDTCEVALYDVTAFLNTTHVARKYAQALETAKNVLEMKKCPEKYPQAIVELKVPNWLES
jgi:hypothetical protein